MASLKTKAHTDADMQRTYEALQRFPGRSEVIIIVDSVDAKDKDSIVRYIMTTPSDLRVSCSTPLRDALAQTIGHEHFEFHATAQKKNGRTNSKDPAR